MRYRIVAASDRGVVRSKNQDNLFCCGFYKQNADDHYWSWKGINDGKDPLILAVFDGMGGMHHGEYAALIASKTINTWYKKYCKSRDDSIQSFVNAANRFICRENARMVSKMGTTCTVIEEQNGRVRSWNLGDSRTYLLRGRALQQLSEDHTEAKSMERLYLKDQMSLEPECHSSNTLTQYLGIEEEDFLIEPYVSKWISLQCGDIALLCSDGLPHMLTDDEIRVLLNSNKCIERKLSDLVTYAKEKGGRDNITVILMEAF